MHHASCIVMTYDIMTFDVMTYEVMTYDIMTYDVMTYDVDHDVPETLIFDMIHDII